MVALWERERSGEGQQVSTSLYGGQLTIQGFNITSAMWNQREQQRQPVEERRPHWSSYECADGKAIMVGGGTPDRWWGDFCDVLGCPELGEGRYFTNMQDPEWRRTARARLAEVLLAKSPDEWIAELSPRFMVQPVRSYLEIAEDEQAWANGYLDYIPREDGDDVPTVGLPVRTEPDAREPAAPRTGARAAHGGGPARGGSRLGRDQRVARPRRVRRDPRGSRRRRLGRLERGEQLSGDGPVRLR